jgi:transcriptional antiterminator
MVNNLTERELKILSYLIDEDDFINGDDLSSRLGISKKTIQREVGSMNEILKDENCAIESVPSKG